MNRLVRAALYQIVKTPNNPGR